MRSQIQISISRNMRMEKFTYVMTMSIITKYRVSLLFVIWSIVTSFAGLHVACIVNEFSQIQNTFLTSQSQHLMNFLLLFCFLGCSLVHPPLWRNLQPKTMLLTLIAGVVEKMRGKWWPVIMHRVKENGSTFSV